MRLQTISGPRSASHSIVAAIGAITISLTSLAPASGAEDAADATAASVEASLEGVKELDPALLLTPVTSDASALIGVPTQVGDGAIEVPSQPEEGIKFTDDDGSQLEVALPFSGRAESAVAIDDGVVVFPGEGSSSTVIVSEGGVQMLTTIDDEDAPTRYEYGLTLEAGQTMDLRGDDVVIVSADGTVELTVAPAWAVDANGDSVPTEYEIAGDTLIQVIEHSEVDAAYPVVADPIWIAPWVFKCLLGLGLSGPQITAAFASGTIWGGLGRAALACVTGR